MAGGIRSNTLDDVNIFFTIGEAIYTQTSIISFEILNVINGAPSGQLSLIDVGSNAITMQESGTMAQIIFTGVGILGSDNKESRLVVTIDDMFEDTTQNGSNTIYTIMWTAGTSKMLDYRTKAFTGTSVSVMQQIFQEYEVPEDITPYPSEGEKLTDTMTWRHVSEDMWGMLNNTVKFSHLNDDYIYWCWDDTSNSFSIGSFGLSNSLDDKYIVAHDETSVSDAVNSTIILDNPEFIIWRYDTIKRSNNLGKVRDKLKPNVTFSVDDGTRKVDGKFGKECFNDTATSMESNQPTTPDQVTQSRNAAVNSKTGFESNAAYAPLKVNRHHKNNVHNLYKFAETYREYKLSTYAKKVAVAIYNTLGPPLGSKVTVITPAKDYKISGETLDLTYSDKYILIGKRIEYQTVDFDEMGRPKPSSNNLVTRLILVSDNFDGDGTEHLIQLSERLKV